LDTFLNAVNISGSVEGAKHLLTALPSGNEKE